MSYPGRAHKTFGQASIGFVVAVTATICLFGFFMVALYWHFELLPKHVQQQQLAIEQAEREQTTDAGSTYEHHKKANKAATANTPQEMNTLTQALSSAIREHDSQAFGETLQKIFGAHSDKTTAQSPEHSHPQTAAQLRDMQVLAFKHRANFALLGFSEQGLKCDVESDVGKRIIQLIHDGGDPDALRFYRDSPCFPTDQSGIIFLVERLLKSEHPTLIEALNQADLDSIPTQTYIHVAQNDYAQKNLKKMKQLLRIAPVRDALRESPTNNIAVNAAYRGYPDFALAIINAQAIHPRLKDKVLQQLIIRVLRNDSEKPLKPMLQLRETQEIGQSELEQYLSAIDVSPTSQRSAVSSTQALWQAFPSMSDHSVTLQQYLIRAVRAENLALTEYLLAQGVDPNPLFLGKSLIKLAQEEAKTDASAMTELLLGYGAQRDFIRSVIVQRGGSALDDCALTERPKLALDWSEQASADCETMMTDCMNSGHGMDDCFNSAPKCSSETAKQPCCTHSTVRDYQRLRCAGLSVMETLHFLER